ncbi:MAG TPA: hypothetical protein VGB57_00580, partial [Allosphingosinicella sp.]
APGIEQQSRAAYVLLSAPDLFPSCGQRELSRWAASNEIPGRFRGKIWGVPPGALCDTRLPANLQLPGQTFDPEEDTVTAVVGMGQRGATPPFARIPDVVRTSSLPDDAAGIFAPGWDVSVDVRDPKGANPTPHLAAYGLGSPFPEDAKLCAALSTFWPAVSPDVYRGLSPHTGNPDLRGSVAPLTDEEIGQSGTLPWDGVPGPRIVQEGGRDWVEMASFLHADYVHNAAENRFSTRLTARITAEEYQRRVLVAARTHWILSGGMDIAQARPQWLFLSFRQIGSGDPELQEAQKEAGHVLRGQPYRIAACFMGDPTSPMPGNPRLRRMPLQRLNLLFVAASDLRALRRRSNDPEFARVDAE